MLLTCPKCGLEFTKSGFKPHVFYCNDVVRRGVRSIKARQWSFLPEKEIIISEVSWREVIYGHWISEYGQWWNGHKQQYCGSITEDGYTQVTIRDEKFSSHVTVALLWIGPPPFPKAQVNHTVETRPLNNHFSNLYYGTQKQNVKDRDANGNGPVGERNGRHILNPEQVISIRIRLSSSTSPFRSLYEQIGREVGVKAGTIRDIHARKIWKHL